MNTVRKLFTFLIAINAFTPIVQLAAALTGGGDDGKRSGCPARLLDGCRKRKANPENTSEIPSSKKLLPEPAVPAPVSESKEEKTEAKIEAKAEQTGVGDDGKRSGCLDRLLGGCRKRKANPENTSAEIPSSKKLLPEPAVPAPAQAPTEEKTPAAVIVPVSSEAERAAINSIPRLSPDERIELLFDASRCGWAACVQSLIKTVPAKQQLAWITTRDKKGDLDGYRAGHTGLHHAAYYGHRNVIDVLINAVPVTKQVDFINTKDYDYDVTALHVAVVKGRRDAVEALIKGLPVEQRSASINHKNCFGITSLQAAVYFGHRDVLTFLLSQPGIDVTVRDNKDKTVRDLNPELFDAAATDAKWTIYKKKLVSRPPMTMIQQSIPNEEKKHRFLDVVIIVDHEKVSNAAAEKGALLALWQEAAPIIISREIWVRILKKNMVDKDPLYTGFDFDRFSIYQGTEGPEWFLIIPKAYAKRLKDNNPEIKNEEVLLGFKVQSRDVLTSRAAGEVLIDRSVHTVSTAGSLPTFSDAMNQTSVDHLLQFFVQKKPSISEAAVVSESKEEKKAALDDVVGTTRSDGLWNIILDGHGYYAANLDQLRTKEGVLAKESGGIQIAGLDLPLFRYVLDFFNKQIATNTLYLSSCYAGDYNLQLPYVPLLIEDKMVAKVSDKNREKKAYQVIPYLDEKTDLPRRGMIKKSISMSVAPYNFTIAVGALTSKITYAVTSDFITDSKESRLENVLLVPDVAFNLARYFYGLRFYGAFDKGTFIQSIKYPTEQLRDVLRYITDQPKNKIEGSRQWSILDPHGISSLPSVRLPGWDTFYPMRLDGTIHVLTPQRIARHILEQGIRGKESEKASLLVTKDAQAVLFCTDTLPINIKIVCDPVNPPTLISMLPGTAVHMIKSMEVSLVFRAFKKLFSIFPVFPKYVYIQKLKLANRTVHHVLVRVQRDEDARKNEFSMVYANASGSIFYTDSEILRDAHRVLLMDRNVDATSMVSMLKSALASYFNIEPVRSLLQLAYIKKKYPQILSRDVNSRKLLFF